MLLVVFFASLSEAVGAILFVKEQNAKTGETKNLKTLNNTISISFFFCYPQNETKK